MLLKCNYICERSAVFPSIVIRNLSLSLSLLKQSRVRINCSYMDVQKSRRKWFLENGMIGVLFGIFAAYHDLVNKPSEKNLICGLWCPDSSFEQ